MAQLLILRVNVIDFLSARQESEPGVDYSQGCERNKEFHQNSLEQRKTDCPPTG